MAELPPFWEAQWDGQGRVFFVDHRSKKTHWEPPLPKGWTEQVDNASGRKYYIDHSTRRTQWVDPRQLYNFTQPTGPSGPTTGAAAAPSGYPSASVAGPTPTTAAPAAASGAYPAALGASGAYPGAAATSSAPYPAGTYPTAGATGGYPTAAAYPSAAGTSYPTAGAAYPTAGASYPTAGTGLAGAGLAGAGLVAGLPEGTADVDNNLRVASQLEPLQVPDSAEDACCNCDTKYSFFKHRHHCRCCGHTFCNECSLTELAVPIQARGYSGAPVRVCKQCEGHLKASDFLCASRYIVWLACEGADPPTLKNRSTAFIGMTEVFKTAAANPTTKLKRTLDLIKKFSSAEKYFGYVKNAINSASGLDRSSGESMAAVALLSLRAFTRCVIMSSWDTSEFIGGVVASGLLPEIVKAMGPAACPECKVAAVECLETLCSQDHPALKDNVRNSGALAGLAESLTSPQPKLQVAAVRSVQVLLQNNQANLKAFRSTGGLISLSSILQAPLGMNPSASEMLPVVEAAVAAIAGALTLHDPTSPAAVEVAAYRDDLISNGAITYFAQLARSGVPKLTNLSIKCMRQLSESPQGSAALLGTTAIAAVVQAVNTSADQTIQEQCVQLLLNVSHYGGAAGRRAISSAGGMGIAASAMLSESDIMKGHAVQLTSELAQDPGQEENIRNAGVLGSLVALLSTAPPPVKAKVVSALATIIAASPVYSLDLVENGAISGLATFMQSGPPDELLRGVSSIFERCFATSAGLAAAAANDLHTIVGPLSDVACRATDPRVQINSLAALASLCGDPKPDQPGAPALTESQRNDITTLAAQCSAALLRNVTASTFIAGMLSNPNSGVRMGALRVATALAALETGADLLARQGAIGGIENMVKTMSDPAELQVAMGFLSRVWNFLGSAHASQANRAAHRESNKSIVSAVLTCCGRCNGDRAVMYHGAAFIKQVCTREEFQALIASRVGPLVQLLIIEALPTQYVVDVAFIICAVANSPERAAMVDGEGYLALLALAQRLDTVENVAVTGAVQALAVLAKAPTYQAALLGETNPGSALFTNVPRMLQLPSGETKAAEGDLTFTPDADVAVATLELLDNMISGGQTGQLSAHTDMVPALLAFLSLTPDDVAIADQLRGRAMNILLRVFGMTPLMWTHIRGNGDFTAALGVFFQSLAAGQLGVAAQACDTISQMCTTNPANVRTFMQRNGGACLMDALRPGREGPGNAQRAQLQTSALKCLTQLLESEGPLAEYSAEMAGSLAAGNAAAALVMMQGNPAAMSALARLAKLCEPAAFWASVASVRQHLIQSLSTALSATTPTPAVVDSVQLMCLLPLGEAGTAWSPTEKSSLRLALQSCVQHVASNPAGAPPSFIPNCVRCISALMASNLGSMGRALHSSRGAEVVMLLLSRTLTVDGGVQLAMQMLEALMREDADATAGQLGQAAFDALVNLLPDARAQSEEGWTEMLAKFVALAKNSAAARKLLVAAGLVAKLEEALSRGRNVQSPASQAAAAEAEAAHQRAVQDYQASVAAARSRHAQVVLSARVQHEAAVAKAQAEYEASAAEAKKAAAGAAPEGESKGEDGGDDEDGAGAGDDAEAEGKGEGESDGETDAAEPPEDVHAPFVPPVFKPPVFTPPPFTAPTTPSAQSPYVNLPTLSAQATSAALQLLSMISELAALRSEVSSRHLLVKIIVEALASRADLPEGQLREDMTQASIRALRFLAPCDASPRSLGVCTNAGAVPVLAKCMFDTPAVVPRVGVVAVAALRVLCTRLGAAQQLLSQRAVAGALLQLSTATEEASPQVVALRVQCAGLLGVIAAHSECTQTLVNDHEAAVCVGTAVVNHAGNPTAATFYLAGVLQSLMSNSSAAHEQLRKVTAAAHTFTSFRALVEACPEPAVADMLTQVSYTLGDEAAWLDAPAQAAHRRRRTSSFSESKLAPAPAAAAAAPPSSSDSRISPAVGSASMPAPSPAGSLPPQQPPRSQPMDPLRQPGYPGLPAYPSANTYLPAPVTPTPGLSGAPAAPATTAPSYGVAPPTYAPASAGSGAPATSSVPPANPGFSYPPGGFPNPGYPAASSGYAGAPAPAPAPAAPTPGAGAPAPGGWAPTGPPAYPGPGSFPHPGMAGGVPPAHSFPPPAPGPGAAGAAPPARMPTSWKCPACTYDNPIALTKCSMCTTDIPPGLAPPSTSAPAPAPAPPAMPPAVPPAGPAPPSRPTSGGPTWKCGQCTFQNTKMLALACEMCGQVRPDIGGGSDIGGAGAPAPSPAPAPAGGDRYDVRCGKAGCGNIINCARGQTKVTCSKCNTLNTLSAVPPPGHTVKCSKCTLTLSVPAGTTRFKCPQCDTQQMLLLK